MKFTRKNNHDIGSPIQRLNICIFSCTSFLLVILINLHHDDLTTPVRVKDNSSNGNTVGNKKFQVDMDPERRILEDARDVTNANGPVDLSATDSLLFSHNAIKNLPPCQAIRYDMSATQFNSSHLALFSRWDVPAISEWNDKLKFKSDYGTYMQYVKGRDVQPLKDTNRKSCTTSTHSLIDAMSQLASEKGEMDVLFFTNDKENPDFINALSESYSIPAPLLEVDAFSTGFRVFSAMERGSSHPFHVHDTAWLGQVTGSRLWFLLPPNTPKQIVGKKVNGCDYLFGHAKLPEGVSACVQSQMDVMYLPPEWLHATCALEPWSVGVGGQGGDPSVYHQKFEQLKRNLNFDVTHERKKMVECGVLKETGS